VFSIRLAYDFNTNICFYFEYVLICLEGYLENDRNALIAALISLLKRSSLIKNNSTSILIFRVKCLLSFIKSYHINTRLQVNNTAKQEYELEYIKVGLLNENR
jgi:hypothetical protein